MYVLMHEIEIAIDVVVKISFRLEIPPWAGFFSRGKNHNLFFFLITVIILKSQGQYNLFEHSWQSFPQTNSNIGGVRIFSLQPIPLKQDKW